MCVLGLGMMNPPDPLAVSVASPRQENRSMSIQKNANYSD
jgi:hypothetical protein